MKTLCLDLICITYFLCFVRLYIWRIFCVVLCLCVLGCASLLDSSRGVLCGLHTRILAYLHTRPWWVASLRWNTPLLEKSSWGIFFARLKNLPGIPNCLMFRIRDWRVCDSDLIDYQLITACCRTSLSAWNGGQVCQIAEDCRRRTSPEGRSCKLQGKAPITGPYTPKWRPNDQEERAHCWVGCRVTDKEFGSCH